MDTNSLKKSPIKTYSEALNYIYSLIPRVIKYPRNIKLRRQELLIELLGNPQDKFKAIHIAGTSGKGSTSTYITNLLLSHGFNVALTVFPHLVDIRERIQIDGKFISKEELLQNLNEILPAIKKVAESEYGKPTYFEVLISLFYYTVAKHKVDYVVAECGLGGLLDATNVVHRKDKVVVITQLGLDHTDILGHTLSQIARQKAGIIHKHNAVFSIYQKPKPTKVLNNIATLNSTKVTYITHGINYKEIKRTDKGLSYSFKYKNTTIPNLQLGSFASYQVDNSSLALGAVSYIAKRDGWKLKKEKVRDTFLKTNFEGRMSIKKLNNGKELILDGAHNPQKMSAFLKSLKGMGLKGKNTFVVSFKKDKDYSKMLKEIINLADHIVITKFLINGEDIIQLAAKPEDIAKELIKLNFKNFTIVENVENAIKNALDTSDTVIVTGSLYFISQVYIEGKFF